MSSLLSSFLQERREGVERGLGAVDILLGVDCLSFGVVLLEYVLQIHILSLLLLAREHIFEVLLFLSLELRFLSLVLGLLLSIADLLGPQLLLQGDLAALLLLLG